MFDLIFVFCLVEFTIYVIILLLFKLYTWRFSILFYSIKLLHQCIVLHSINCWISMLVWVPHRDARHRCLHCDVETCFCISKIINTSLFFIKTIAIIYKTKQGWCWECTATKQSVYSVIKTGNICWLHGANSILCDGKKIRLYLWNFYALYIYCFILICIINNLFLLGYRLFYITILLNTMKKAMFDILIKENSHSSLVGCR